MKRCLHSSPPLVFSYLFLSPIIKSQPDMSFYSCPRDSFLHYYSCCDDNPYQCCFHFETWAVFVKFRLVIANLLITWYSVLFIFIDTLTTITPGRKVPRETSLVTHADYMIQFYYCNYL
ncbi:unnamed protein product [Haemonchus placei]|uniref:7TM_GPCR_Srx domain-containing protein n=1 Tax=Haemonchus placei TaxID=6290 RepID=A0A0N4X4A7_HAEPC|nr:unnamed protein product [Haemonchus placei]